MHLTWTDIQVGDLVEIVDLVADGQVFGRWLILEKEPTYPWFQSIFFEDGYTARKSLFDRADFENGGVYALGDHDDYMLYLIRDGERHELKV